MEIWIAVLLLGCALSGWAGYLLASRRAPKPEELAALAAELDAARLKADAVQADVAEHFEQSARLFGKLAGDYREFLEHFAGSAQTLGLSESRTRELVRQSFQPLLTHEVDDLVVTTEPESEASSAEAIEEEVSRDEPQSVRVAEVTIGEAELQAHAEPSSEHDAAADAEATPIEKTA